MRLRREKERDSEKNKKIVFYLVFFEWSHCVASRPFSSGGNNNSNTTTAPAASIALVFIIFHSQNQLAKHPIIVNFIALKGFRDWKLASLDCVLKNMSLLNQFGSLSKRQLTRLFKSLNCSRNY